MDTSSRADVCDLLDTIKAQLEFLGVAVEGMDATVNPFVANDSSKTGMVMFIDTIIRQVELARERTVGHRPYDHA